jgi:hypothetical protein
MRDLYLPPSLGLLLSTGSIEGSKLYGIFAILGQRPCLRRNLRQNKQQRPLPRLSMSPADEEDSYPASASKLDLSDVLNRSKDKHRVEASWLINAIIAVLRERGRKGTITAKQLKEAYEKNEVIKAWEARRTKPKESGPKVFPAHEVKTYGHLFGFRDDAVRGYAPPEGQTPSKDVQIRHIETIDASLQLLSIYRKDEAPSFDEEPASWVPFLEYALAAVKGEAAKTSPASTGIEKPVGSANEEPAATSYRQESLLDIETLRAVNITGPAAPEAVEFFAKRNFRFRIPPYFMGREETLSAIDTAFKLANGALAIAVLHGLRGVGKTTLAFAYAVRRADDYRAIWRISAQSEPTMRAELAALGVNLGWVDKNEKEDAALAVVMDRLPEDGDGILLIYDNSTDAVILTPYLPKSGSARILITSTSPASGWRAIVSTSKLGPRI